MGNTRAELEGRLAQKGYRLTRPREAILELLRATSAHPQADWIYEQVRKQLPHISLGTVYRTLHVLAEAGCIQELRFGSGQAHYDGNVQMHYHLICTRCGAWEDLDMPLARELEQVAAQRSGYRITGHRLEFYGLCRRCQS